MAFLNLTLRFLLEIGALVALCWAGFHLPTSWPVRLLVAIGGPVLAAVTWGSYVAPRAPWRVQGWARLVPELAVFGAAAVALYWAGYVRTAWVFAVLAVLNTIAVHVWGEPGMSSRETRNSKLETRRSKLEGPDGTSSFDIRSSGDE